MEDDRRRQSPFRLLPEMLQRQLPTPNGLAMTPHCAGDDHSARTNRQEIAHESSFESCRSRSCSFAQDVFDEPRGRFARGKRPATPLWKERIHRCYRRVGAQMMLKPRRNSMLRTTCSAPALSSSTTQIRRTQKAGSSRSGAA